MALQVFVETQGKVILDFNTHVWSVHDTILKYHKFVIKREIYFSQFCRLEIKDPVD